MEKDPREAEKIAIKKKVIRKVPPKLFCGSTCVLQVKNKITEIFFS